MSKLLSEATLHLLNDYFGKDNFQRVHALCFISNVYKQWFFKLVPFFENLSNSTSLLEKLKQHR